MHEDRTIEHKVRQFCADMRAEGYSEQDIFFALREEARRIDLLINPSNSNGKRTVTRTSVYATYK